MLLSAADSLAQDPVTEAFEPTVSLPRLSAGVDPTTLSSVPVTPRKSSIDDEEMERISAQIIALERVLPRLRRQVVRLQGAAAAVRSRFMEGSFGFTVNVKSIDCQLYRSDDSVVPLSLSASEGDQAAALILHCFIRNIHIQRRLCYKSIKPSDDDENMVNV